MGLTDDDKQWIRELMEQLIEASEGRYREQLEGVETKLLTEFHRWASPLEARPRTRIAPLPVTQ